MFDEEQADFVCSFLECLTCSNGQPFVLMDWQREAVRSFYGEEIQPEDRDYPVRRYQYLYLEIPKKNGKSELAAGLAVYHLYADGETNGEVYAVAADRENAGIVFNAAKYMVENCRPLAKRSRIVDSTKTIFDNASGSRLKVLSAEAYSKHGYKPSCVIFDELHAQKSRELWDVMTFGAGDAREQPVWIVLTTAGDDPDRASIGWEVHEKALSILHAREGKEDGIDDPRWLPIIYGLGLYEDDVCSRLDIYSEALWRLCNPSIGKTLKLSTIRAEAEDAKRSPAAERLFRWLRLNQWIAVHTIGWIPLDVYDKTECALSPEDLYGMDCVGGVDLSKVTDLTAFALLFPPQPGLDTWVALVEAWTPLADIDDRGRRDHAPYREWVNAGYLHGCEGNIIDFEDLFSAFERAARLYNLVRLGFDPYLGATLTQRVQDEIPSCEVVLVSQGIRTISPPMKEMEVLLRKEEMRHLRNPALRWCFGNMRCKTDENENIKPVKGRSRARIDMTVAWIIAYAAARGLQEPTVADIIASDDWSM